VAIGLPSSPQAAGSGYAPPAEVMKALNYLARGQSYGGRYVLRRAGGYPNFRGVMTFSINWESLQRLCVLARRSPGAEQLAVTRRSSGTLVTHWDRHRLAWTSQSRFFC